MPGAAVYHREVLEVRIPAKVNLHLRVLGRRPDGFHEVHTLLQSIDLYDRLRTEPARDGVLELAVQPGGAAPADDSNLVLRAARALWDRAGRRPGAGLVLDKRIPAGAGLGGGSADAAAALVALDSLWGLGLTVAELADVGAGLGSDVPFFLHGGLALGVGRGERIRPLDDITPLGVVVAAPRVEVSTAAVYSELDAPLTWPEDVDTLADVVTSTPTTVELRWERLENDLEPVVVVGWPEVAEVLSSLRATRPLYAAVTGSGAASVAVYPGRRQAATAAASVSGAGWIHVGSTVRRSEAEPVVRGGDAR